MHYIGMEECFPLHGLGDEFGKAISMVPPILFILFREYCIESLLQDGLKPGDDNQVILNAHANKCAYLWYNSYGQALGVHMCIAFPQVWLHCRYLQGRHGSLSGSDKISVIRTSDLPYLYSQRGYPQGFPPTDDIIRNTWLC